MQKSCLNAGVIVYPRSKDREEWNICNCRCHFGLERHNHYEQLQAFSNFHPCTFEVAGVKYNTSEQFIQNTKVWFFNDPRTANAIMDAVTLQECKQLPKNISGYDPVSWSKMAKTLCKPKIQNLLGCLSSLKTNCWWKHAIKSYGELEYLYTTLIA